MSVVQQNLHVATVGSTADDVKGFERSNISVPSIGKEMIEVLDILLRWFVLRFCQCITSCLLKVLKYLPELFDMLRIEGYTLTESQAAIFIPCLVEKG
ncbi:hypothetical protein RHGRI_007939 [Rhododendron griersonianum]|uniref:Uncharacterized protein n=1 Tax=Rhododendron griersonianum TaxID=479676 RepID=A0AAV6KYZ6_9ERIC|nr:hypothetical protein RHGRI_007939 [Rhododendron griersonianum]